MTADRTAIRRRGTRWPWGYLAWVVVGHVIATALLLVGDQGAVAFIFGWLFGGLFLVAVMPFDTKIDSTGGDRD